MTFNEIFKSSFLENVSSISVLDMLLTIVLSFGIGLFIFLIYKKTYRGVMYAAGFGTTLIALTMIIPVSYCPRSSLPRSVHCPHIHLHPD